MTEHPSNPHFYPQTLAQFKIIVVPLQQQNSFASRQNCRRVIFFIINYESESKNVTIQFTIWPCQERNVK